MARFNLIAGAGAELLAGMPAGRIAGTRAPRVLAVLLIDLFVLGLNLFIGSATAKSHLLHLR